MKITKKVLAVILAALFVVAGTVFFVVRAFSSDEQTALAPTRAEAQTTQAQAPVVEPEIVEETTEFSVAETTTQSAKPAPKKAATETTTAPEQFVEVSEIAVFSQQDLVVNEAPIVVEETTAKTEETTGYEPVYDDPLPPEGYDWVE